MVQPTVSGIKNGQTQEFFHPNITGHRFLRDAYRSQGGLRFVQDVAATGPLPASGTLIQDQVSGARFVAVGGTLAGFEDAGEVASSGYAGAPVTRVNVGTIEALASAPLADGTLLRDAATGVVYLISGGTKTAVTTQAAASGGAVTVPKRYLDAVPDASSPSAVIDHDGQREVFFNANGQLDIVWFDGTRWNGPLALAGPITGSPFAVVEPDGQREVFFNSNGRLGDAWFDLKRWNGPAILGGPVS